MTQTQAIAAIKELRLRLEELESLIAAQERLSLAINRFSRWCDRTLATLEEFVNLDERKRFEEASFTFLDVETSNNDEVEEAHDRCHAYLDSLIDDLKEYPDHYERHAAREALPTSSKSNVGSDIFLIHGHDLTNTLLLKDHLREKLKLKAKILRFEPGKGRTLIEKFEEEANGATYAFALFTADDVVGGDNKGYAQARPNVVFELGWFCGRLGREKICILFKRGTRVPSDLDGIERHEFTSSVEEVYSKIADELVAAKIVKK